MKSLVIVGLSVLLWMTPVSAQTLPTPPANSDAPTNTTSIDMIVEVGTQSPWNGEIPVTLKYKSALAGQKAQVIWKYPSFLQGEQPDRQYYPYAKDSVRVIKNTLKPTSPGNYTLVVDVVIWGYDSNYINTERVSIAIDDNLLVTPQTEAYRQAVLLKNVTLLALGVVGLIAIFVAIKIFVGKVIPHWLESEVNRPS